MDMALFESYLLWGDYFEWINNFDSFVEALRHVNQIKDPSIHESAINIIVEVVDIILRAEEELDYADYESGKDLFIGKMEMKLVLMIEK